ncbi:MAG: SWIM zinc finger family protein [Candidatus Bathyarchaeota archaeon]|nr:SWIM zinc finger family protein [Candidatus Bathyarchaeota archaeon]
MKQTIPRKEAYLKEHGIYPESYRGFKRSLKKNFRKRKDLLSKTKIRESTGQRPEVVEKYLKAMVELGDIRTCEAFYLGCSLLELIIADFPHGMVTFCPTCNEEIILPPSEIELLCKCGIHYTKQASRWVYKPRIEYLGNASWRLESLTHPGKEFYEVRPFDDYCSCPHHSIRGAHCKHLTQVTELVANIISEEIIGDSKFKATGGLIVIATALDRLLDRRKKLKQLTYRMLGNAMEKSGLNSSKAALARIISDLAKKQAVSRTHLPLSYIEGKTLIDLNPAILKRFRELDKSIIDSYTKSFIVQLLEHRTPFLKLDNVEYPDIILPNGEFDLSVDVNYCFPKPTPVRLELSDAQSHTILRSFTVRLNGEDVRSIPLKLSSLEMQAWVPQIELYCQDDKKEWHLVDHYLAGRPIVAPKIIMRKTVAGLYEVESFTQPGKFYEVDYIRKKCTCPAYSWNQPCKHLELVKDLHFSHLTNVMNG